MFNLQRYGRCGNHLRPMSILSEAQMRRVAGGSADAPQLNPPSSTDAYAASGHTLIGHSPRLRLGPELVPTILS